MKYLITLLTSSLLMIGAHAQEPSTITTTGQSTVYAQPDEAYISFSVITYDNDIAEAKSKNSEISKRTLKFLKKMKVEEKHVQTQYLNIGRNYRYERNPGSEYEFMATQQFSVCVKDLDNLEEIMTGLLSLQISNLGTPSFRTSKLDQLKREASKKAVTDAKEKAQIIAGQLEQEIGKAHQIKELNFQGPVAFRAYAASEASADGGGNSFALGQLEITSHIEVSFLLE